MRVEVVDLRQEAGLERRFEDITYFEDDFWPHGRAEELAFDAYTLLQDTHVREDVFDRGDRYVFTLEDDGLVGMCSLRERVIPDHVKEAEMAVELFEMAVEEERRGEGIGRYTFDLAMEEAESMAEEDGIDYLYMKVHDLPTETYSEVCQELEDRGKLHGEKYVRDYCDQNGVVVEELYDENEPMRYMAEEYGFEKIEESLMSVTYLKEL